MGVAKAALEASCVLAADFGPRASRQRHSAGQCAHGGCRIANAPSCSISRKAIRRCAAGHLEDVGGAALFLLSSLSSAVTGEIVYVDAGYNVISMPNPEDLKNGEDEADGKNGIAWKAAE